MNVSETKYVKARVEYSDDGTFTAGHLDKIDIQRLAYREVGREERVWISDSEDLQSIAFGQRCLEFEFVTKGEVARTTLTPWTLIEDPEKIRFVLTTPAGVEIMKLLQYPIALLGVDSTKGLGGEVIEETWRGVAKAGFVPT